MYMYIAMDFMQHVQIFQATVDPHLSEPQLSDFPDYPNTNFMRSNEIHVCI